MTFVLNHNGNPQKCQFRRLSKWSMREQGEERLSRIVVVDLGRLVVVECSTSRYRIQMDVVGKVVEGVARDVALGQTQVVAAAADGDGVEDMRTYSDVVAFVVAAADTEHTSAADVAANTDSTFHSPFHYTIVDRRAASPPPF